MNRQNVIVRTTPNRPQVRHAGKGLWLPAMAFLLSTAYAALPPIVPFSTASADAYKLEQGMVQDKALKWGPISAPATPVAQGAKWEIRFPLEGRWKNPFDPREISVDAVVKTPDGKRVSIPGFFAAPCALNSLGRMVATGSPVWKVRYTPGVAGTHSWQLTARDASGTAIQTTGTFDVVNGPYAGLVRVSKAVPTVFEYASGKPFHPVGWNLIPSWAPPDTFPSNRIKVLTAQLDALAGAGGNFVRLRADSYYLPIEGINVEKTGYLGVGWYQQGTCQETDEVYERAEARGIQVMHCLMEGNAITGKDFAPALRRLHYEFKANGGPCENGEDFFKNEEMLRLVKQRLRYVVARWGYSPSLMAWEIFNEINTHSEGGEEHGVVTEYHRQIARFLKTLDPYGRMVTTSSHLRGSVAEQQVFRVREIDFSQIHMYGYINPAAEYPETAREFQKAFAKPIFFGEYGKNAEKPSPTDDPLGIHIHNALMSSALGATSGVANWFVDMIFRQGHLGHFSNATRFLSDVPWNDPGLSELAFDGVTALPGTGKVKAATVLLTPKAVDPFKKSAVERFVVDPLTKEVKGAEFLQKFLHCKAERKTRPTFILDCSQDAVFIARVTRSVGDEKNALVVYVDGVEAKRVPFPAGAGLGIRSEENTQWKQWTVDYQEEVRVPVPKGKREVMVEAVGKDRLELTMGIENYSTALDPVAMVGRGNGRDGWIWIRNTVNTDLNERLGIIPMALGGATARVSGLADGTYLLDYRDPWGPRKIAPVTVAAVGGKLPIRTPDFQRSLLLRITKR